MPPDRSQTGSFYDAVYQAAAKIPAGQVATYGQIAFLAGHPRAGRIVGGAGVIDNDFHDRKDLTPNLCALYVEPDCRGRGIAVRLIRLACAEQMAAGTKALYLLTDHTGFYERYGWEFFGTVVPDGETRPARIYRYPADLPKD